MLALSSGFLVTIKLFVLTLLGSLPLGLLIAFTSMSRVRLIKVISRTVVWIVRGTPLLLQLIVIYYGPGLMFGNNLWGGSNAGRFIAALVAFIFNYACYFSEIYRGGIESISKGQYEAGQVLGVLLQVIKRIIPPMGNELINLVKDTSLARVIAVYELIWAGQAFIKSSGIIWPLLMTGVFYLVFSGILVLAFNALEKKLSYFES